MDFNKDYYRVLGLKVKATAAEVKAAYRSQAKKFHPDLHPNDPDCESRIKEINEAWEVLGNGEQRFIYDTFKEAERAEANKVPPVQEPVKPKPGQRTSTRKQWAAREKKYYLSGELVMKFRGIQDEFLTVDVLKEVVYNLKPTDVRAHIKQDDIFYEAMPPHFRARFDGPKINLKVPQPVKATVSGPWGNRHYLLEIKDLVIPTVTVRDVTKDDGDSFGTLSGIFYGYISIVQYVEVESQITEFYGPTGKKDFKTEQGGRYERREYYHADGSTYWSNWAATGPKSTGYTGRRYGYDKRSVKAAGDAGCLSYVFGLLFLIFVLPKLIWIWPVGLLFLLLWLISVKRWSGIFVLVSGFAALLFLFSLFSTYHQKTDQHPVSVVKSLKKRVTKKAVPGSRDTLITHLRSWSDYEGKVYEGKYSVSQSALRAAGRYKQDLAVDAEGEVAYDMMLQKLLSKDKRQLKGLYAMLDRIRDRDKLDRKKFAEMFVSMVQDIPYAIVLPQECDSSLYHDRFISGYLGRTDARCDANQRFGINTPVEFLAGLNGDCDTRTLLIFTVLSHYKYDVALLSSTPYSHSLIGVDLPYEGAAYEGPEGRYVLWETTSKSAPGLLPNDINNLDYWRISLISKP
ncbi:J domain-containing protein [Mucilaginibacter lutimaris]|uniref:J domain-containing protein n=1 Tax=Mucilaginibacter lutimaris TaxID=931629 RepID=A0ABW2ZGE4_9SPHI